MVAPATLKKQANELITLFSTLYEEKHHEKPDINRYKQGWGFQDMITDLGIKNSREVVEYYIGLKKPVHGAQELLYNYDRYSKALAEIEADEKHRAELRLATGKRVKEWESKFGN